MTIARTVAIGPWLAAGLVLGIPLMIVTAHAEDAAVPARTIPGDHRPAPPILLSVEVVPDKDDPHAAAAAETCDPRIARCETPPSPPDTAEAPAH
jgi:hypothetical protein